MLRLVAHAHFCSMLPLLTTIASAKLACQATCLLDAVPHQHAYPKHIAMDVTVVKHLETDVMIHVMFDEIVTCPTLLKN